MQQKILFVCSGNTCRSPMAVAIFRKMIEEDNALRERILADSAGVDATDGLGATPNAIQAVKSYGATLEGHRAKKLTDKLVKESDLILAMDRRTKDNVIGRFRKTSDKTHLLSGFVGETDDVADPIGSGPETYAKRASQIACYLLKLRDKLRQEVCQTGN